MMILGPRFAAVCLAVIGGTAAALVVTLSGGSSASQSARAAAAAPRRNTACAPSRSASRPPGRAGDTLAFVRYQSGSYGIFILSLHAGAAHRLGAAPHTPLPPTRQSFQDTPTWSPDGRSIAFASDRNGKYGVYVMRADGSHTRRLSISPDGDVAPSWSPDGRSIAFSRGAQGVYLMHADGSGARPLTHPTNTKDSDPAWSPDGTRIAFVREEPGIGSALFLVRPNGHGLCEITPFTGSVDSPAWSPDGRELAYSTGDGHGFGIALVGADGRGRRMLTPQGLDFHPAWSPDGRMIAFTREATLYVMNSDGSHLRRITPRRAIDGSPAWRPTA